MAEMPLHQNEPPPRWSEADRLSAVHQYGIDTPSEQAFDDLTTIAKHVCQTPIALVNFLLEGPQWFKAEIGLRKHETSIDGAFCTHVIAQPHLFVVPDTTKDSRFRSNSLVTEVPHLRFYAGAPLVTGDGMPIGTLCVLDYIPRAGVTLAQGEVLLALARQATILLEFRRTVLRLGEFERKQTPNVPAG